ncbi:MAG: leucine-rich repeat protein [Oscillospiraceae bacterium]|nr:leucine-rich repeat protein [Oscillospiraceae bacterium]
MLKQKLSSAAVSLSVLIQMTAGAFGALPAHAAQQSGSMGFAEFAARVRTAAAGDADRALFQEIVYDPAGGTLSQDGAAASDSAGALSVRNGRLMLDTGASSGGQTGVQSAGRYAAFDQAGADYGYCTKAQPDGTQIITNDFQTARLIVKAEGRIDPHGAVQVTEGWNDLHILQYADSAAAYAAYQCYEADAQVRFVQPSRRIVLDTETADSELAGSEPVVHNTWGAGLVGTDSFIAEYLNAELLPDVTVAVIDTGINPAPAVFRGRILEGGINVSDSGDDTANDDLYHGTHVSGTICELTPSNVKILPVKVFDSDGTAADEQIYLGMMYALEQGADILNMSFGGLGVSPLEIEAMSIADEHGVICCAASGNNADDAAYYYPGGIESCITVGAIDSAMNRAAFSNYGKLVDVTAPGVGIRSYVLGDTEKIEAKNGTSMATPHVAACCALLRSYDKSITPRRAEALLQRNAVDLGTPGFDDDYGWGVVCMKDFQWDDGICLAPEFSRKSGNFGSAQTVELSTGTEQAEIYYTTDGTAPAKETGIRYDEPVRITETTWLRAIAVREGFADSVESEAVYAIGGRDTAYAWDIRDGVLYRYRGIRSGVQVPEGETVTAVAAGAFQGNHFVKDVTLPDTVTAIGESAFADCAALETVTAAGAAVIGARAFADSPLLRAVTLSSEPESVGSAAFSGCASLTAAALPGIAEIPAGCFFGCKSLISVSVPDATRFGDSAFWQCAALRTLDCRWDRVTAIGSGAFAGCSAWAGDLRLASLETVGSAAFSGDSALMRVSLPESVTALPEAVFSGCRGLRLLQLPGVTALGAEALALGSSRSDLTAVLPYDRITSVGRNAFYGFRIGGSFSVTEFSALQSLSARSFAGVSAGALAFPQITAVPEEAFAEAGVTLVSFPQADSLAEGSVTGCRAVVLERENCDLRASAFGENAWLVAPESYTGAEEISALNFCAEPLILSVSPLEQTVPQHTAAPLQMIAGGFGMTCQWYTVSGSSVSAVAGADSLTCYPDTSEPGNYVYRCILTDSAGKTEQLDYRLHVLKEEDAPGALLPDDTQYAAGEEPAQYRLTVPESGIWQVISEGAVPVGMTLTDARGSEPVLSVTELRGRTVLQAALTAGGIYDLTVTPHWAGIRSLTLTQRSPSERDIADCSIRAAASGTLPFGTPYQPVLTVTAPDGTVLTEQTDYTVQVQDHNQNRTVSVFGTGAYSGCTQITVTVRNTVPADTPVPVTLSSAEDSAVFAFIPKTTGTYYYYATAASGYAEELTAYNRIGRYVSGSRYVSIQTVCTVADTPEGDRTVFDSNSYSPATGNYFYSKVQLNAGQTYYFICAAQSAAEYNLVITQTPYDLRDASIDGAWFGFYTEGRTYSPKLKVTVGGKLLTEGTDFQRIDINSDIPGKASVRIVGSGLYLGSAEQRYELLFTDSVGYENRTELDSPRTVTCADERLETFWFEVNDAEEDAVRYRILNERISGGRLLYRLYRYQPETYSYTLISTADGTDYMLTNGQYFVMCFRQYPEQAAAARFTVLKPYLLADAELTIGNVPYTGSEAPPALTVTMPDGTVLTEEEDYTVLYAGSNIMFGTVQFVLRSTNRSYGMRMESYEIEVVLPEDAPELETGDHSVFLDYENRLAIYRVSADTDTEYSLLCSEVPDIVLRVFSPDCELLAQDYGNSTKSVSFTVPAGEMRYVMVKFNGTERMGTIHFRLDTELRLLSACEAEALPHFYTGEPVAPQVTLSDGDYILQEGRDYRLRYTADDVNIGKATANYIGMGQYFGTLDVEYPIVAESLFEIENMESFAVQISQVYLPEEETDCDYLIYRYTAGTDMEMKADIFNCMCSLTMQRYDTEGHYLESCSVRTAADMQFTVSAGETCYFLFSATDISGWNQTFRFLLNDQAINSDTLKEDRENGVTYRIKPETGYAEVYLFDEETEQIRLLPRVPGTDLQPYTPEGLFRGLPEETVVYGYPGCEAAYYADLYHFAYIELSENESTVPGDLNGDGRCSEADVVLLTRIICETEALSLTDSMLGRADLNGDGSIDLRDLPRLIALLPA